MRVASSTWALVIFRHSFQSLPWCGAMRRYSTPTSPAAKKPVAPKKSKTPPRSPAQVEYDEAVEAAKKANEAVETAREKLAAANRMVQFQAGQKMVHALLSRAEKESRESTLGAFLDVAAGGEKQVIIDYLGALNVAAELEKKATGKG